MIRVVVVEDSPSVRNLIIHILSSDSEIEVVGNAADGEEAITSVARLAPDAVTMDIVMPRMNGLEATREIMSVTPVPIIVVSSTIDPEQVNASFSAMEAGAVAAVPKPVAVTSPLYDHVSKHLIRTVKLMSEVRVVHRRLRSAVGVDEPQGETKIPKVVAIGSSTGGPPVLGEIFSSLRTPPTFPILVVQHIAAGFIPGLAQWLESRSGIPTRLAVDGEQARAGTIYLAPDGCHMGIRFNGCIVLSDGPSQYGLKPSVAVLFDQVRNAYGRQSVGILLTGMGRDGSEELKALRETGAVTIAQNKESSVVHGMAGHAIAIDAVRHILTPAQIATHLDRLSIAQSKELQYEK